MCVTGCTSGNVTGIHYDTYGNAVAIPGPNNRCSTIAYDQIFAQLPQTTVKFLAGCNAAPSGQAPYTTGTIYDRGFEQVVQQTSPYSQVVPLVTTMKYEPFGRVAEVDQPSADLAGLTDANPAVLTQYSDVGPARYVVSQTIDGPQNNPTYATHYKVIDGLGETLYAVDQFDQSGDWTISRMQTRYPNGLAQRHFQPFIFSGDPTAYAGVGVYAAPYLGDLTTYDGASRPLTYLNFANTRPATYSYAFNQANGAQCSTAIDPEQQAGGLHPGSSTTTCSDGHGRASTAVQTLAYGENGQAYAVTTATTYTATGERTAITQSTGASVYARHMTYDSLGRMVGQTEPNTGTWQYVYNDSGDLVGLEDPRGCGKVIYHDGLGRVIAEDYSPCPSSDSPTYSHPNLTTGDGAEAFYVYDGYGNVGVSSDRAQTSTYTFDPRNRPGGVQRQIAVPGGSPVLATRYAPNAYRKEFGAYSEANRLLQYTSGADSPGLGSFKQAQNVLTYDITGGLQTVGGAYGLLITRQRFDASGRLLGRYYGDAALTSTNIAYDNQGRPTYYAVARPPGPWTSYEQGSSPPATTDFTTQSYLTSLTLAYDQVGNPLSMIQGMATSEGGDGSPGLVVAEWPAGALPTTGRDQISYWDDYRINGISTQYAGPNGDDIAGAPGNPYTAAEVESSAYPSLFSRPNRVRAQLFAYDFRGNVTLSADDTNDYWDRGPGSVTYSTPGNDRVTGFVAGGTVTYDPMGNIATLSNPHGDTYEFTWDEVGRLASATREDAGGTITSERYAYDAGGERVLTQKTPAGSTQDTYTVNVFDSLALKNAAYPDANGDFEHDDTTEHAYIRADGEMLADSFFDTTGTLPSAQASFAPHVFMTVADPQGSSSYVIDYGTSELVEAQTYQAYGAVESDYRPARWNAFREDVRYTGQWDNGEIGLVYMHARYYMPELGRFISPDPKTIHGAAGDLNPYEYAYGSPLRHTDPTGLGPDDDGSLDSSPPPDPLPEGFGSGGVLQVPETQIVGNSPGVIPVSFDQTTPHAGALVYNQSGSASWTEFFAASGKGLDSLLTTPGTVEIDSNIGTITTGSDGLPTTSSLQAAMEWVLAHQGANGLSGVILPGVNADAALAYAQSARDNSPRYSSFSLGSGNYNCATFVCGALNAAGVQAPPAIVPSAITDFLSISYPSFALTRGGSISAIAPAPSPSSLNLDSQWGY